MITKNELISAVGAQLRVKKAIAVKTIDVEGAPIYRTAELPVMRINYEQDGLTIYVQDDERK